MEDQRHIRVEEYRHGRFHYYCLKCIELEYPRGEQWTWYEFSGRLYPCCGCGKPFPMLAPFGGIGIEKAGCNLPMYATALSVRRMRRALEREDVPF